MQEKVLTGNISFTDAANLLYAQSSKKDKEITDLLSQIECETLDLTASIDNKDKYDILLSVEYLFTRARILTEFESIKVKQILYDKNTPAALKPFFTTRDVFLSQISAKLTLIRDDLNVLQRFQYLQNIKN